MQVINHELIAESHQKVRGMLGSSIHDETATTTIEELLKHWKQSAPVQYRQKFSQEAILDNLDVCEKCVNSLTDVKVKGSGPYEADVMLVGEGPGEEEVKQGKPFVGPAGQLLDKILSAGNIVRDKLFVTNAVICRTDSGNRAPTKDEICNCGARLIAEVKVVAPELLVCVGSQAMKALGVQGSITTVSGTVAKSPLFFDTPVFILLHPAYLMHSKGTDKEISIKKRMLDDILGLEKYCREKGLNVF